MDDNTKPKRFLTFNQLRDRWGGVSDMSIENWLRKNPGLLKTHQIPGSQLRLFDEAEVEAVERRSVVARSSKGARARGANTAEKQAVA